MGVIIPVFFLKRKENVFTAKLISALWKEGHSSKLKEPEVSTSYKIKLSFFGILTNLQHSFFFPGFFFFKDCLIQFLAIV